MQRHVYIMTPQEQAEKIEEIYNDAIQKLDVLLRERKSLVKERRDAIRGYIKDLETKKIEAIKNSLVLLTNQ